MLGFKNDCLNFKETYIFQQQFKYIFKRFHKFEISYYAI